MGLNHSVRFLLDHIFQRDYFEINKTSVDQRLSENLSYLVRNGIPPQYIVAGTDFFGQEMLVAPGTFIPRPETEGLIDLILGIKEYHLGLEIGIGAGVISIALLSKMHHLYMVGTEISIPAIEICRSNLITHGLQNRMGIVIAPDLRSLPDQTFDLVIANPPYIPTRLLRNLPKRVRFEPRVALDGGESGASAIELIIKGARRVLKKGGIIGLEIDPSVSTSIPPLLTGFSHFAFHQDFSGLDRYLVGEK